MKIKNYFKKNFLNLRTVFFENIGIKQTIFKNIFWLAIAEGITRFLKLILIIYVARILGAAEYGKFAFALSFVALFVVFFNFGLSDIITREFSRDKQKEKEFPAIFSLKILLSLGTLTLIIIGSFFITPDSVIQKIIWILAIYIFISSFSSIIYAFLRSRQRMEYESFAKILQALVITITGFFVILNFPSIVNLSYSYLFAALTALIFILVFFHLKIFPLSFQWKKTIWRKFLAMSWPLALTGIFATIYSQIDSVMMGYWGQIIQTGWYNAGAKVAGATLIPAILVSQGLFPSLSIAFKKSKERLQKIWNVQMETMIFLAVPLVVGGMTLAPKIIDFIYDQSYAPSVFAFQILITTAGVIFLHSSFYQILVVSNQQKIIFWTVFFGALVNIILNIVLIPKFSLYGAAFATLITHLLIFVLFLKFTFELTSINPFNLKFFLSFFVAVLSSILMCFVIFHTQICHIHVFFAILIGILVYSICFFFFRKLLCRK